MAASKPTPRLSGEIDILPPFTLNRCFGALTTVWVVPLSEFKLTPNPRLPGSTILLFLELDREPRDFSPIIPYPYLYQSRNLPQGLTTANFDWNQLSPSSIGFSPLDPGQKNACPQNLFGPPSPITETSPCPGLDRSVSGPAPVTSSTFILCP